MPQVIYPFACHANPTIALALPSPCRIPCQSIIPGPNLDLGAAVAKSWFEFIAFGDGAAVEKMVIPKSIQIKHDRPQHDSRSVTTPTTTHTADPANSPRRAQPAQRPAFRTSPMYSTNRTVSRATPPLFPTQHASPTSPI